MPPITDPMALQQIALQQQQPSPPDPMAGSSPMSGGLASIPLPPRPVRFKDPLKERREQVQTTQAEAEMPANIQEKTANASLASIRAANEAAIPWDDKSVDYVAHAMAGGAPITQITGGFGMGSSGRINQTKVIERLTEIQGTKGLTGEDQARQLAHYAAGKAALAQAEKQFISIQGAEGTTHENMRNYLGLSEHLPLQTGSPALNSVIQFGQKQLPLPGHDDVVAMEGAGKTALNEYSRIMSNSPTGAGVLTDTAREEGQAVMRGAYSKSQKEAVWKLMQADMNNRIAATRGALDQAYVNLTKVPGYKIPNSLSDLPANPSLIDAETQKKNEALIRSIYQNDSTGLESGDAGTEASTTAQAKPFPMAYQAEHAQFINENRGKLTPEAYEAFRRAEDQKYGVSEQSLDPTEVEKFVHGVNSGAEVTAIPSQSIPLEGADKTKAENSASPLMTGIEAAANAGSFGAVDAALSDNQKVALAAIKEKNWKSADAGELIGSIAGMGGLERLGLKGLSTVAKKSNSEIVKEILANPTTRQKLLGDVAVNAGYGASRGFNAADEGQGGAGAAEGALGGAAGAGIGNFVTKGVTPLLSEGTQSALAKLAGVKTTTLQKLGMGQGEAAISDLPVIKGAREKSLQSFVMDNANRALSNIKGEGGQSLGVTVPKGLKSGTEINAFVTDKLGEGFNAIKPKVVGAVDGTFDKEIKALAKQADTPAKKKLFAEINSAVKLLPDENGHYNGDSYQAAQTKLRTLVQDFATAAENNGDTAARDISGLANDARKAIRDLVARQTPAVAGQIKGLEQGWAHKMRIEDATLRALKANNETYSPGQYLDAVKKLDFSKSRVAAGRGFDQDYAAAAKQILGSGASKQFSIRDTGIATGLAALATGSAAAAHPGVLPTMAGLGTALYAPGVKRAVAAALIKRPNAAEHPLTEEAIRRGIADAMRRLMTGEN